MAAVEIPARVRFQSTLRCSSSYVAPSRCRNRPVSGTAAQPALDMPELMYCTLGEGRTPRVCPFLFFSVHRHEGKEQKPCTTQPPKSTTPYPDPATPTCRIPTPRCRNPSDTDATVYDGLRQNKFRNPAPPSPRRTWTNGKRNYICD